MTPPSRISDVVVSNITTQGFFAEDVGKAKVAAVTGTIMGLDDSVRVETIQDRYRSKSLSHLTIWVHRPSGCMSRKDCIPANGQLVACTPPKN